MDASQHSDTGVAGHLFAQACSDGKLSVVRELLAIDGSRRIDVHADNEIAFIWACGSGCVEVVRELLALGGERCIDVHARNSRGFRMACFAGKLDVVRELLALNGDRRINVHADNGAALSEACGRGKLDVVRRLLALDGDRRIDVHADNEAAFRQACGFDQVDVVRELLALDGDRRIDVHADNEAAFRQACRFDKVDVVRELLALNGDRRINVHAGDWGGFREACHRGSLYVLQELLDLEGDRRICSHGGGGESDDDGGGALLVLQKTLLQVLQYWSGANLEALIAFLRGARIPVSLLQAVVAVANEEEPEQVTGVETCQRRARDVAQAVTRQVLLHSLQQAMAAAEADTETDSDGIFDPADMEIERRKVVLIALALCCALPGAECGPLVGQLATAVATEAAAGMSNDWSHTFALYRDCVWRGVAVPVDVGSGGGDMGGLLRRVGRRGLVLARAAGQTR